MKRFRKVIILVVLVYLCLAGILFLRASSTASQSNFAYKVEIHEAMRELSQGKAVDELNIEEYQTIKEIAFMSVEEATDAKEQSEFYAGANGVHTCIRPYVENDIVKGFVRFDYGLEMQDNSMILLVQGVLFLAFLGVLMLLVYIQKVILNPFYTNSELPYELSKGHLSLDVEESKHRFFGKFLWGLSMLGDSLKDSRTKELKLLKEKKLLLLSISHDIKIPLSAIKLYAKALKENLYDSKEKCNEAAGMIETHAKEIEEFVKQIVVASSEEILNIEVVNSEFYLKDFIQKVQAVYGPKLAVTLTDFEVGHYDNKLIKGDFEKAFEVMENLLENAMKYGDGKRISLDFYEEEYCQVIRIFNTGEPVAADQLPHLFDSFYRGSNASDKQGNGLGLYIAKQIMNKMEGEIFAERQSGGMSISLVFRM